MPISRMQQPRQMYGLGSFVKKAVKKVTNVAKDIVGSDVGKAALLGIGAFGLPTAAGQKIFSGFAPDFLRTAGMNFLKGDTAKKIGGVLRDVAVGTGIAGATDYFTRPDELPEKIGGRSPEEIGKVVSQMKENYRNLGYEEGEIDLLIEDYIQQNYPGYAEGGRIGFSGGSGKTITLMDGTKVYIPSGSSTSSGGLKDQIYSSSKGDLLREEILAKMLFSDGGRAKYALGDRAEDNAMQASGIMGLPLNQNPAGATEIDMRDTGGFIPPVGVKEKEDDIPAMLSNNEFVFTADAVRGMGDGDVNIGAQRMYDMMKKLENGGRV